MKKCKRCGKPAPLDAAGEPPSRWIVLWRGRSFEELHCPECMLSPQTETVSAAGSSSRVASVDVDEGAA